MKKILLVSALLSVSVNAAAQDQCLAAVTGPAESFQDLHGQLVISTLSRSGQRDTEVIAADDAAIQKLTGDEGFRIASVTKTFVAATVLRLWEDDKIDLEAPITRWLPKEWTDQLVKDGYQPQKITVRHLLSHTSGLADHAQASQFIQTILANPKTEWSRAIDVQRLVEWTDPVAKPGKMYSYSDTGYVLLGHIVESITGQDLPSAVRTQLKLDALGLSHTYWEKYEPARGTRAHQLFDGGVDTYEWSPTLDLFGGGGLVATPQDMATFFAALLDGKVFKRAETLALMKSQAGLPKDSPYRLGLLTYDYEGVPAIGHSGFWGTLVVQEPGSGQIIAGAVTHRADYPRLKELVAAYVRRAASKEPGNACHSPGLETVK